MGTQRGTSRENNAAISAKGLHRIVRLSNFRINAQRADLGRDQVHVLPAEIQNGYGVSLFHGGNYKPDSGAQAMRLGPPPAIPKNPPPCDPIKIAGPRRPWRRPTWMQGRYPGCSTGRVPRPHIRNGYTVYRRYKRRSCYRRTINRRVATNW